MPLDPTTRPEGYPAELESEVLLADGRVAKIRPIVPGDAVALRDDLGAHLSEESLYFRFFTPRRSIPESELDHFATVDYSTRLALVAFVDGTLVAVARFERLADSGEAEVAFTVRDDQQGRGLGMVLLEHLASAARARGVRTFSADTLAQNRKMLQVFRRAGFDETAAFESGVVHVTLDLEAAGARYAEQVEERDRAAAVASIRRLLEPSSIAVVGASRQPGKVGHEIVAALRRGGFRGAIYPVNRTGAEVLGLKAYTDVRDVPSPIDLVVVAVPAAEVPAVVQACGSAGAGGLVVVSAGFAETGAAGAAVERRLVAAARAHGMRMIGPNCLGVVNTSPEVSMNATFARVRPLAGHVAFSSQSGGLGAAILTEATERDLGLSVFASVGNKADVSGNDLLRYFEADDNTRVILLYLESFGNPRHFATIARRVARTKPIVAVKSGRSRSGARGAMAHTAAVASPDAAVDALFRQAGVIRVDTLEELFDVAELLSHQPLPPGGRVGIVGNVGGPGVLAADACEGAGLEVPELSAATKKTLSSFLPGEAAVANPVDCLPTVSPAEYGRAVETVLADEGVDSVIAVFTPPLAEPADEVATVVAEVSARSDKPVVAIFLAGGRELAALRGGARRVPWFAYPESAARALARVGAYAAWRARPDVPVPVFADIDVAAARAVVEEALSSGGGWLGQTAVLRLMGAFKIPCVEAVRCASPAEAVAAARAVRGPVAVKLEAPGLGHRSDAGGLRLGVRGARGVERAASELLARGGDRAAVLVQAMVAPGPECAVGVVDEPGFGPLVSVGVSGPASEVLGDRALALVPLSRPDAVRLLSSLEASPLLAGYRSTPPADIPALAELLCRVAQLAEQLPEVAEMELDPVVAGPEGAVVLDPRVRVASAERPPQLRRRHVRD